MCVNSKNFVVGNILQKIRIFKLITLKTYYYGTKRSL